MDFVDVLLQQLLAEQEGKDVTSLVRGQGG